MLDTLTKESWEPYIGDGFQVDAGSVGLMAMKLATVSGYGHRQHGNREAYSLLFQGAMQPVLPQGIYRVVHADLGELDIFLVPIGPQSEGMGYEAVFT